MPLDEDTISKPFKKLRKSLRQLPRVAAPEQVHKLRTAARRIEATIHALTLDSSKNGSDLLKPLTRLRKKAGKVRDMDVFTAQTSHVEIKGEEECLIRLLEYLGAKRFRQARKLHSLVKNDGSKLQKGLKLTKQTVGSRLDPNGDNKSRAGVEAEVMEAARELTEKLRQPVVLNQSNLHPYRLKVKELRYILQMFKVDDDDLGASLGQVKDSIGEWHDWLELVAIARDVLPHGRNCGLIRQLKEITDKKYKEALLATNRMRKRFLRTKRRRPAIATSPKPMLITTSAIAA